MLTRTLVAAVCVALSRTLGAQTLSLPSLHAVPGEPVPGSIVRLTLTQPAEHADSIVAIKGSMAGEPLRFLAADSGRYHAIGAVPVGASDSVAARVIVERVSGVFDTLLITVPVPHATPVAVEPRLAVDQRFTKPLDAKTQARIARENALAASVGRRSHESPPLWSGAFHKPRDSRVTSQFGTGRMFNGVMASRHLGVDYQGVSGAPVLAANRGVVALVDTFFLAGRVVYIDHGGGVVTGYFHLTRPLVAKGDTVARGQRIGLVGATGRVTGPHLHWSARYGALAVNPLDLIDLPVASYSAVTGQPPHDP